MPAAPLPSDEQRRLHKLHALAVLDTAAEAFSDAVTLAAAAIANVPVAAISLVDGQRQWFKGSLGLDMEQTPREVAFCSYTILDASRPLVVGDAQLDPRFSDNPLVHGDLRVRFYAGFPIVVDGHAVGALCVLDDHSRTLEPQQLQRLTTLADGVAAWLAGFRQKGTT